MDGMRLEGQRESLLDRESVCWMSEPDIALTQGYRSF